jgi:15-cis-phytoene desaturase
MAKVAILGGGVAGLSAAHELAERGFEVAVYELKDIWGGKARSMGKPGTGADGRQDLPGEHGFRFFPGFYKHLPDTMKRIPFGHNPQGVFDNLVGTTQIGLLQETGQDVFFPANFPTTLKDWKEAVKVLFHTNYGLPHEEVEVFVHQLVVILTSCEERRLAEYEKIPWWDFIEAESCSDQYKKLMGKGLTRSLVAMRAEIASTRTVGDILIQLILNSFTPGVLVDRVLKGPTNDVWIHPWIDYLKKRNVALHLKAKTKRLNFDGRKITSATVEIDGNEQDVQADYFICAVPVEVMRGLVTDPLKQAAPSLAHLDKLNTDWMNGIQFYLAKDTPVNRGHAIYLDSNWAITSISQHQFWRSIKLDSYGDGKVRGILSIDISNWQTPGNKVVNKPAQECTPDEIKDEVWAQVKAHLNEEGKVQLEDSHLLAWHLDPDIVWPRKKDENQGNAEPLLINTVDSWQHRPEAQTDIPNLLLASDYVRTYTDLATMEGAKRPGGRSTPSWMRKNRHRRAANSGRCTSRYSSPRSVNSTGFASSWACRTGAGYSALS